MNVSGITDRLETECARSLRRCGDLCGCSEPGLLAALAIAFGRGVADFEPRWSPTDTDTTGDHRDSKDPAAPGSAPRQSKEDPQRRPDQPTSTRTGSTPPDACSKSPRRSHHCHDQRVNSFVRIRQLFVIEALQPRVPFVQKQPRTREPQDQLPGVHGIVVVVVVAPLGSGAGRGIADENVTATWLISSPYWSKATI